MQQKAETVKFLSKGISNITRTFIMTEDNKLYGAGEVIYGIHQRGNSDGFIYIETAKWSFNNQMITDIVCGQDFTTFITI